MRTDHAYLRSNTLLESLIDQWYAWTHLIPPRVFRSFFTSEQPARYSRYEGSGARWRYFGHACILLETPTLSILFDPVLSYTYESGISRYTYDDLPEKIDYVVITHNHQDHVLLETLLQIRHKVGCVVVPVQGADRSRIHHSS
jgi:glyoxylase-like metal-dependent hydrolase (beta-lactamase superfamily II)